MINGLVVGSRCLVGTNRRSVVSTVETSGLVVVINTASVGRGDSGTSVGSVVAWANVVVNGSSKTASGNRDSGNFGVAEVVVALFALPELHAGALGVAVGWARAVALLLLVVLGHEKLEGNGDEEEEAVLILAYIVVDG
jgi:hypothetical protein